MTMTYNVVLFILVSERATVQKHHHEVSDGNW